MKHLLLSLVLGAFVAAGVYLAIAIPLYTQMSAPIPHPPGVVAFLHHKSNTPPSAFVIAAPFGLAAFLGSTVLIWLLQSFFARKAS